MCENSNYSTKSCISLLCSTFYFKVVLQYEYGFFEYAFWKVHIQEAWHRELWSKIMRSENGQTQRDLIMPLKEMSSKGIKVSTQGTHGTLQEWFMTESPDSLIPWLLSATVFSFSCMYFFLPVISELLPESVQICLDFMLPKLKVTTPLLFYTE